ncbi:hypothetical protein BK659_10865 [Pseudomonas brassicacearum]|uniref:Uncharacterized protein n=2 Tax=Pseudomonas brassicacearum TaxID=930166 RepID=A0A423H8B4_9PSED|nr:hypothetical protein BK659_10865 [Pseudomonas brassicacearum]
MFKRALIRSALIGLALGLFIRPVGAEVVQITAEFKPDPSRPNVNEFKNTTPNSGHCTRHEAQCKRWQIFSIGTLIELHADRAIPARHTDPRQGAMFNVPAGWKDVPIFDTHGKASGVVQVRIAGIGGQYQLSERVQQLIGRELDPVYAHSLLWREGSWLDPPPPCGMGGVTRSEDYTVEFFWTTPVEGVCSMQAAYDIPGFSYKSVDFAYQLQTPNPLKMAPGVYTATTLYTVGPGADFDMGNIMQPTDGTIQLAFTLTVDHVFNIELPPGGHKVELIPQGGWQAWLQQGRKPARLFRDQTFNIWTSTPFKMQLKCAIEIGNTCGLRNEEGKEVPVQVAVSLPHGLADVTHSPVNKRPLQLDGIGTEKFEPNVYVDRKPGTLHFEIRKESVEQMLAFDGRKYTGDVTVIWDSEV